MSVFERFNVSLVQMAIGIIIEAVKAVDLVKKEMQKGLQVSSIEMLGGVLLTSECSIMNVFVAILLLKKQMNI